MSRKIPLLKKKKPKECVNSTATGHGQLYYKGLMNNVQVFCQDGVVIHQVETVIGKDTMAHEFQIFPYLEKVFLA